MQLADFDFNLPEALIAQHPPAVRGSSRLLAALPDTAMADKMFADLPDWVQPGDVLVIAGKGGQTAALMGTLMLSACKKRGLAGVIVDGAIRD